MLIISGCCNEDITPQDRVTKALRKYPLTTYIDSSGNYLQILVVDSFYDTRESGMDANCLAQVPRTTGVFYPMIEGKLMRYRQMYGYNRLEVNDVMFSVSDYNSSGSSTSDTTLHIQGFPYEHCQHFIETDSLGFKQELGLSPAYGIVLFSYRDQYRWERVLD
jgi:hypothetical protein